MDLSVIDVRGAFEGSTAPENRFIIQRLGNLGGRRVHDMAAGVRSEDEHPLDMGRTFKTVHSMFRSVEYDVLLLTTLWIFLYLKKLPLMKRMCWNMAAATK
jgi:hypothetical protein